VQSTARWLEQCKKVLENFTEQVDLTSSLKHYVQQLPSAFEEAKTYLSAAYPLIESLARFDTKDSSDTGYDYRPTFRFELGCIPEQLAGLAAEISKCFTRVTVLLEQVSDELEEAMDDELSSIDKYDAENWFPLMGAMRMRADGNRALWSLYRKNDAPADVPLARWVALVDFNGVIDFEVSCSPILAANALQKSLWEKCFAAVLTSATMTALGKFERFIMRAGTPEASSYHIVPSPFDYAKAGTLVIPAMKCDPTDAAAHTAALIDYLPEIIEAQEGTLVLFASRRQMWNVFEGMPTELRDIIIIQGDKPKQEMLKEHRQKIDAGGGSVLFGLASFAEGVDLPGRYCTHVIIAKIPFAVPDDPVDATLSDWIEANGRNSFMEIAIPDAAIKLVQASGRLLRNESDSGKITLLDRRVITKRYGKMLLDALPPYKREVA
jgi:ATP-dependent DNA helicase DinG